MANYLIDPAVLQPYLPCYTELDTFNGNHYVSLVGFLFTDTKVRGIAVPFHRTFEEVNLRFYVRYKEAGNWKRGVVFMKEIVPKRAITIIANTFYKEKYATYPMRHSWEETADGLQVEYGWKVGSEWNFLKAITECEGQAITAGTEEEFITEHYWGYTTIDQACTGTYEVVHPKWKVHRVKEFTSYCNVLSLYGQPFEEALRQRPQSVFLAEGSAVQVMIGSKIRTP
ncbi:MAG: hypothetical protein JWP88_1171 [Flaviaesturariibacter sp.]|nr:hypothetical protein [Flaviaesturariibacter sp.]